ncbi:HEAT repeat domain-containing protein [Crassaminicella thermophila]|nr:HEAT repeat domain-containing protein [Crassaminicella thermophila]
MQQKRLSLSWDDINIKKDYMITYLLYKEGKGIDLIASIRNMTVEKVKKQLILAKSEIFSVSTEEKSILDKMLEATKSKRYEMLSSIKMKDKKILVREIYKRYNYINNPDDKMIVIWIIGELGIQKLIPIIYQDIQHPHGNVRRMVCSAINKIGDADSIEYLHRALLDSKPQVRQYAAKALGKLGNKKSIKKIKSLICNPKEKEYVKRAFQEAICNIERRLENS